MAVINWPIPGESQELLWLAEVSAFGPSAAAFPSAFEGAGLGCCAWEQLLLEMVL